MRMSNETYDKLKWIALIALPALVVLVETIGKIWGIPYTSEIALTIAAFAVFLGSLLKKSSDNYAMSEETEAMGRGEEDVHSEEEIDS